jgi:beta-mannosidase
MKKTISLNGEWDFKVKDSDTKITVPSNWYLQGHDFAGEAEYSRSFNIEKEKGKKYFVVFNGVDYFAEVLINGKFAGRHEGYFQKFRFDITPHLKAGENKLTVKVNSPKEDISIWPDKKYLIKGIFNHHDARPGSWNKKTGQDKNTGGIWNDTAIEVVDEVEIRRLKITPYLKADGVWNVGCEMQVMNYENVPVSADVTELMAPHTFKGKEEKLTKKTILYPGMNTVVLHTDLKNPRLWWTWDFGQPDLYKFNLSVKTENGVRDAVEEISGIREFRKGTDNFWYLNGKRIFLRGTNIIPTQWLSEYTQEKIKKDVKMLKDANLNIVRIHAHVNRAELYREFDREGIMVWQDFALQWGYETTPAFMENASAQIKDMINMHYNRTSIVIWCCHNEPFVNEKQLDPVLYKKVREEDSGRYIEQASDFKQHHYQGWYYDDNFINAAGTFENLKNAFLLSEYGAQGLPCLDTIKKMEKIVATGIWPPDFNAWEYHDFQYKTTIDIARVSMGNSIEEFIENSQAFQAKLIKEQTETFRLQRYKMTNGILHFMFCECWPSITWAVVDYYRIPKKGYFQLKESMQPVLPGFRLFTTRISQGDPIGFGQLWKLFFVINDSPKPIENASANISISGPSGKTYFDKTVTLPLIPADTAVFPFDSGAVFESFENDKFNTPRDAEIGTHSMDITLKTGKGKLIGTNKYSFQVVKAGLKPDPWSRG